MPNRPESKWTSRKSVPWGWRLLWQSVHMGRWAHHRCRKVWLRALHSYCTFHSPGPSKDERRRVRGLITHVVCSKMDRLRRWIRSTALGFFDFDELDVLSSWKWFLHLRYSAKLWMKPKLHPGHLRLDSAHGTKVALLLSFDLWLCSLLTVLAPLEETFILSVILYSQNSKSFNMTPSKSQDPFAFETAQNGSLSHGLGSLTFADHKTESDLPIRPSILFMQNRSAVQDSNAASQDSYAFDSRENMRDKHKTQDKDRNPEFKVETYIQPSISFISRKPTVFHTVDYIAKRLASHGFTKFSERESWGLKLSRGGKISTEQS